MREVIRVENVSKEYPLRHTGKGGSRFFQALSHVSFGINAGEIVGITGPNGSGKSTLLKILSGITKPTSGRIEITGRVAAILDIGTGFHPDLSGRENVFLNGQLLGFSKREIRERFDEILDFSGIGDFIDQPVKNYSNGMYLRLAFSILIHLECDILLLDEVLAVGDQDFMKKCLRALQEKKAKGVTALIVSHNKELLTYLCTRLITISHSEVVENERTFFDEDSRYENDDHITLESISHHITDREVELELVLKNIHGYESLDVGLSFDLPEMVHSRFTLSSVHNRSAQVFAAPAETGCRLTAVIPRNNIKPGSYSISVYVIKDRKMITRNFLNCHVCEIPEPATEDLFLKFYPNPLRLFLDWKKSNL